MAEVHKMATGSPKYFLQNYFIPLYNQCRSLVKNKVTAGGIQYNGFKYHPRRPDFKDPPYNPERLFLLTRIKPVAGTNPVERRALQILNIDGHIKQRGHIAIIKNIPEVGKLLWRIKHLIEIVPIRFVNGLPKDGDFSGTWLHANGDFVVSHKLKIPQERIEATEAFNKNPTRFNSTVLKKYLRDKWDSPLDGGCQ